MKIVDVRHVMDTLARGFDREYANSLIDFEAGDFGDYVEVKIRIRKTSKVGDEKGVMRKMIMPSWQS